MGDMHIVHKQVIRPNTGFTVILNRTAVNGHVFTDDVIVANDQSCRLTSVLFVLAFFTNGGELKNTIPFADNRWAFDHHMGTQPTIITNFDARTDIGPRANSDVIANFCIGMHKR